MNKTLKLLAPWSCKVRRKGELIELVSRKRTVLLIGVAVSAGVTLLLALSSIELVDPAFYLVVVVGIVLPWLLITVVTLFQKSIHATIAVGCSSKPPELLAWSDGSLSVERKQLLRISATSAATSSLASEVTRDSDLEKWWAVDLITAGGAYPIAVLSQRAAKSLAHHLSDQLECS